MVKLDAPLVVALAALVLTAAAWDVVTRRIPNLLVIGGVLLGFVLQSGIHGWAGFRTAGLGFLFGFAVFLPIMLLSGKGAGDIKLMAAVGAIAGHNNVPLIFVLIALAGGVMAVVLLLWRGGGWRVLGNIVFILGELIRLRPPHQRRPELSLDHPKAVTLPYGVAIAAGALFFLLL